MKKRLLATVLVSGITLAAMAPAALAAPVKENEDTQVQVNLTEGGYIPGEKTDFYGNLRIVHKPDMFIFEEKAMGSAFEIENKGKTGNGQFITIGDDRRDEQNEEEKKPGNWKLQGKLSKLESGNDLLEANIRFDAQNKDMFFYTFGVDPNEPKKLYPVDVVKDKPVGANAIYELKSGVELEANGGQETIISADVSKGTIDKDETNVSLDLKDASLVVGDKKGNKVGNYKGIITWELTDSL